MFLKNPFSAIVNGQVQQEATAVSTVILAEKKNTETMNLHSGFGKFCGAYRIRTDDFLAASQVL
jgi:hypothetical protein